jgi:molecular chaperone DnaK
MGKIVGIDLGTTTSALSYLNDIGRPEVVANADGERIMPSAVYFADEKRVLTGKEAIRSRQECVSRSVRWIKRKMGDENFAVYIDGKSYSPAEISSFIIKKLIQDAELQIGPISDVLITVPANFEDAARNATINAGKIAGVNVIGLVNEPTAAAFYYAVVHNIKGKTLIFDLGGGTLDVTIATIDNTDVKIINSKGDRNLGGFNFDQLLVSYFEDYYSKETNGGKLFENEEEKAIIEDYAEDTKISLSKKQTVSFRLQGCEGSVKGEISREKYAEIINRELMRIQLLVECTLEEANETPETIDHVILVGGSTRLPAVRDLLVNIFGKSPEMVGNVDEVVSLGAALYAGRRIADENPENLPMSIAVAMKQSQTLVDVCNHSYGTLAMTDNLLRRCEELQNTIIIKKNTPIPCHVTHDFYTRFDGQKSIDASITQGEEIDPDLVTVIANQEFALPPNTPAGSVIRVTYSYDKDQRMDCEFLHVDSGKRICLQVDTKEANDSANRNSSRKINDWELE